MRIDFNLKYKRFTSKINIYFVLVLFLSLIIFCGLWITPDSWAYIDGAKNISNGLGYKYLCNDSPVIVFQPLYSIYLCVFLFIDLPDGFLILFANSFLFFGTAWFIVWLKLKNGEGSFFLIAAILLFLIKAYFYVLSENLFYPLILIQIYYYNILKNEHTNSIFTNLLFLSLLDILIILTKNSGIINVLVGNVFLLFYLRKKLIIKFIFIALKTSINIFVFFFSKLIYGGAGSHPMKWNSGKYSLLENMTQSIIDIPSKLIDNHMLNRYPILFVICTLIIILFIITYKIKINTIILLYCVGCYLGTLLILNSVHVFDTYSGRYTTYLYLIFICFANFEIRKQIFQKTAIWLISICLAINSMYYIYHNLLRTDINIEAIKINQFLFTGPIERKSNPYLMKSNNKTYIVSPCYEWTK